MERGPLLTGAGFSVDGITEFTSTESL